jgi:hypothetical protein
MALSRDVVVRVRRPAVRGLRCPVEPAFAGMISVFFGTY